MSITLCVISIIAFTQTSIGSCDFFQTNKLGLVMKSKILSKDKTEEFFLEAIEHQNLNQYLDEISYFRIKYFKEFPYLYEGNYDYEKHYLNGFFVDEKSLLLVIKNKDGQLVAVSTSLPLVSKSDITDGAPELFNKKGLNPKEFFYYGEVIIKPEFRGIGLSSKIFEIQEKYAKTNGYRSIALSTVVRSETDQRKPFNHTPHDKIWTKLGFKKANITTKYNWPTIQGNGQVIDETNIMSYWIKDIN